MFPTADRETVDAIALHVSTGRNTARDAVMFLRDMVGATEVQRAIVNTDTVEQEQRQSNFDHAKVDTIVTAYTTSMTNDRQVRDHCRQLTSALYLLRVKFVEVDVADNLYMHKKLSKIVAARSLGDENEAVKLPYLFVGDDLVGDYWCVQELIDSETFFPTLARFGFRHQPLPL